MDHREGRKEVGTGPWRRRIRSMSRTIYQEEEKKVGAGPCNGNVPKKTQKNINFLQIGLDPSPSPLEM